VGHTNAERIGSFVTSIKNFPEIDKALNVEVSRLQVFSMTEFSTDNQLKCRIHNPKENLSSAKSIGYSQPQIQPTHSSVNPHLLGEMVAMDRAKILVVDDDPAVRNLIYRFLSKQNYQMESAADGKTARTVFEQFNPNLVILDVNLPDANGYSLCQEFQALTGVFVLMLTSRTDEADKITGFEKGADDYLTKPFSLGELGVRVGAILKRQRAVTQAVQQRLMFDQLIIDPVRREVTLNNQSVSLTALEFDLLHFLASHPGRVWRRSELIHAVWDYEYVGDQRVVDVHIGQIRKKIETDADQPALIQTVRGVGYKFELKGAKPDNGK
jgi:two-component system, OmpR family, response regulator